MAAGWPRRESSAPLGGRNPSSVIRLSTLTCRMTPLLPNELMRKVSRIMLSSLYIFAMLALVHSPPELKNSVISERMSVMVSYLESDSRMLNMMLVIAILV